MSVLMNVLVMIIATVAGFSQPWFFAVGALFAMVLPFIMHRTSKDVMRSTFLNSTLFSLGVVVALVKWINIGSVTSLISSVVLLFGVHSAITLLICILNYFVFRIAHKNNILPQI